MKQLLTRAIVGTAMVSLAVVLATFVLPEEQDWLPRWLATSPGEAPMFSTAVILVFIAVILRLGFDWAMRDFVAAFLVSEIILVLGEFRSYGFGTAALGADFILGSLSLAIAFGTGLLLSTGLRKLAQRWHAGAERSDGSSANPLEFGSEVADEAGS
jgi:hypothetical protein